MVIKASPSSPTSQKNVSSSMKSKPLNGENIKSQVPPVGDVKAALDAAMDELVDMDDDDDDDDIVMAVEDIKSNDDAKEDTDGGMTTNGDATELIKVKNDDLDAVNEKDKEPTGKRIAKTHTGKPKPPSITLPSNSYPPQRSPKSPPGGITRKPVKGILKPAPPPTRSSSWIVNVGSRIGNVITAAATPATPTPQVPATSSDKMSVTMQPPPPGAPRQAGFGALRRLMSTTGRPSAPGSPTAAGGYSTTTQDPALQIPVTLSPDMLRRVRFSLMNLTTEYPPSPEEENLPPNSILHDNFQSPSPPPVGQVDEQVVPSFQLAPSAPIFDPNSHTLATSELTNSDVNLPIPSNSSSTSTTQLTPEQRHLRRMQRDLAVRLKKQEVEQQTYNEVIWTAHEIVGSYVQACGFREEQPVEGILAALTTIPQSNDISLDLTNELITTKAAVPLADVFTLNFGMRKLLLEGCGVEDDALRILMHSLLLTDTVEELSLANNRKIRADGFKYIAIYVKKSKSLKSLNLSATILDKISSKYLTEAILPSSDSSETPPLETLLLDQSLTRSPIPLLEILAPALRRTNLRTLTLRQNKINHLGALWLGVLLRDYDDASEGPRSSQESLPLSLERSLVWRHGIEILDVEGNELRSGVQYVAQSLRRNRSLRWLGLRDCRIDGRGLVSLGEGLRYNRGLESLDLSRNTLMKPTNDGMVSLKDALTRNKFLRTLVLSETEMNSEGAITLAESLPENRSLTHLYFAHNPLIDIAGVMALSVSVKLNWTIICLDVNVPPNDKEMARLSREILQVCIRNTEKLNEGRPESERHPVPEVPMTPVSPSSGKMEWITNVADEEKVRRNVREAQEAVKLLEEMIEAKEKKNGDEEIGDAMLQLKTQCEQAHPLIIEYIGIVSNEELLRELLATNDKITTTLKHFQDIYQPIPNSGNSIPESLPDPPSPQQSLPSTQTPPVPTFSIGDDDDEDDDEIDSFDSDFENISSRSSVQPSRPSLAVNTQNLRSPSPSSERSEEARSPLEELRKEQEEQEGEILRRAKELDRELTEEEEEEEEEEKKEIEKVEN